MEKVAIVVQARMGATRLPKKPLKKVLGRPLLSYLIERLKRVSNAGQLAIATTSEVQDDPIVQLSQEENVAVVRGSVDDVLSRYLLAADALRADAIVRITADCPLMDPHIVEEAISQFTKKRGSLDYLSNTLKRTYPRGMDVEIFSYSALALAAKRGELPEEREHVTPFIYRHPELFVSKNFAYFEDAASYRLTVDTIEDFHLIEKIIEILYPHNPHFTLEDILNLLRKRPDLVAINQHIQQKTL